MDIISKIRNKIEYAFINKLKDKALKNMTDHILDDDSEEFRYWADLACSYTKIITHMIHHNKY